MIGSGRQGGLGLRATPLWACLALSLLPACADCGRPDATCASDSDCRVDEFCIAGVCRRSCNSGSDCSGHEICQNGICVPGATDAAPRDTPAADRSAAGDASVSRDAATRDVAALDSALTDRAPSDATGPDTRDPDAWAPDAWAHDAWAPDAWAPDTSARDTSAPDIPGIDASTCSEECPYAGARECLDATRYRLCGQFDADNCLEWDSIPRTCETGSVCHTNNCTTPPGCSIDVSCYCCSPPECYGGEVECTTDVSGAVPSAGAASASGYIWFNDGRITGVTYCGTGMTNRYDTAAGSDVFTFSYAHRDTLEADCWTVSRCSQPFSWDLVCP
ncbi:MAG: hypothetical protein JXR83_06265 [Deltaproteobacteria bacterium]|nr:hypothetical protein [Deltaproteobacteria bacterium]